MEDVTLSKIFKTDVLSRSVAIAVAVIAMIQVPQARRGEGET